MPFDDWLISYRQQRRHKMISQHSHLHQLRSIAENNTPTFNCQYYIPCKISLVVKAEVLRTVVKAREVVLLT